MDDFNNRMTAQRELLKVVNARVWPNENLFSLSGKAIDRWLSANGIDRDAPLAQLVCAASRALFFLANKSQEQITDEYRGRSKEFARLLDSVTLEEKQ